MRIVILVRLSQLADAKQHNAGANRRAINLMMRSKLIARPVQRFVMPLLLDSLSLLASLIPETS
jgi:hypothetical protein